MSKLILGAPLGLSVHIGYWRDVTLHLGFSLPTCDLRQELVSDIAFDENHVR